MPQPSMMYVLSYILENIPMQMLELAFRPRENNTTIEKRIVSKIVEGPVLLDTNLVGGKQREIIMNSAWKMPLASEPTQSVLTGGVGSSYYVVPPEAREHRDISSVLGITRFMGANISGGSAVYNGHNGGLTANNLLKEMLGSHTMTNTGVMPSVTMEDTNVLRFYPQMINDGIAVRVMLEQDAEFLNMNPSAIMALRNLCLCATKRFIAKELIVPVDETQIVAGMEIGVIKNLIMDYKQDAEQYNALLIKLKGAMHYDPRSVSKLMYYAL